MHHATSAALSVGLPVPPYHWPWLARTSLLARMRAAGIPKLQAVADWAPVEVQEAMLPDRSGWLLLWMNRIANGSLK
jgi:hypothetical protein